MSENDKPANDDTITEELAPTSCFPMPAVREQRQCCGNCNAFAQTSMSEGICRALPPAPIMIGMGRPAIELGGMGASPQPVVNGFFPPVGVQIWCRMWQPKIGNVN